MTVTAIRSAAAAVRTARSPAPSAVDVLESERGAWFLAAIGVAIVLLSVSAAVISDPGRSSVIGATGMIAAIGTALGLGWRTRSRVVGWLAAPAVVLITGAYAGISYGVTPTVVWLFAYLVPAVGLARGTRAGAIAGLVVRIVDVYDALRSERPYKPAWSEDEVLEELRRLRGAHFDPELTDLFLALRGA